MPAPILRRYAVSSGGPGVTVDLVPAVPAGRAFVASKLVLHTRGQSTTTYWFNLWVGTSAGDVDLFLQNVPVAPGESYTETGIIVPAGSRIIMSAAQTLNGAFATGGFSMVFGQEVDNV